MTLGEKRALKVFLCHASDDKPAVRGLYKRLSIEGVDAWLDEEKLLPGQDWSKEILEALQDSDAIVICLSKTSVAKEGYVQREIKEALKKAEEKPSGTIFVIPAKLDNCEVPAYLNIWHWVDLFEEDGFMKLLRSLKLRADAVGAVVTPFAYGDIDDETERRLDQYYTEGLAAFYTEDWNKACQRFQLILSERPGNQKVIEKFEEAERQRDLSKLYAQSVEAYQAKDWQAAIKILDELLKKTLSYKDSAELFKSAKKQRQLGELYIEAKKLHAAKKWDAVLKVFEQIFAIEPQQPDPDQLLPSAQKEAAELKRLADLNDLYRQAVREMDSDKWYEARSLLEQVHKAQTGFLETESLLRKVEDEVLKIEKVNERVNQINTLYEQAHGLIRSKNWRNALDKVEEIQKLDSQFEDKDGIAEKAKAELEREGQEVQKQNQLAAMYADAVRLLKEGKYQEALDKWNEVKAIDSKYPDRQQVQKSVRKKLTEMDSVVKEGSTVIRYKVLWPRLIIAGVLVATIIGAILLFNNYIYYDRFNEDIYDGKINTQLWNPVSSLPSYVRQQDDMLALSVSSNEAISSAFIKKDLKLDQTHFIESDVLLSGNKTGTNGDAGIIIETIDSTGQNVNFTCIISRYGAVSMWCEVFDKSGAEYSTNKINTDYDTWHNFRIKLDSEVNATFYIDGEIVGSYKPTNAKDLMNKDIAISLRVWTPSENLEARYDDVKFGLYK